MLFNELSETAQAKAVSAQREDIIENGLSDMWYDATLEDIKNCGAELGIDIEKVYFSGFSSQGDGACFEGRYSYKKGSRTGIKSHAPKDETLHGIAEELFDIQRKNFYKIGAKVAHRGHYYHEHCTEIDVWHDDMSTWDEPACSDGLREVLRDFMRWSYRLLEKEYDWYNSDEGIAEELRGLEVEFNEEGEEL